MDYHGDLEPIAGDVWVVRQEGRWLVGEGEQLAQTAVLISQVGTTLAGQQGRFVDAAVDQAGVIAGQVIRLSGVSGEAGMAALRYADVLEVGQRAANAAIEEDGQLHYQFELLRVQASELERQALFEVNRPGFDAVPF